VLYSIGNFLIRDANLLWFMTFLPLVCGALLWLAKKSCALKLAVASFSSVLNLLFALGLFSIGGASVQIPFAPFGFEYSFRADGLSSLFLISAGAVFLPVALQSVLSLRDTPRSGLYLFCLFSGMALINGALLSDGLGTLLFFWEGLLCTLFGILLIHSGKNPGTAVKALTIAGLSDLLLMLGIIVTTHLSGSSNISQMGSLPAGGICLFGFLCMMLGAAGQGGLMPFHSWIPDAAKGAPAVFMAAFWGTQALLGGYLGLRIVLTVYDLQPGSGLSAAVMVIGAATALLASAAALAQNDMKRLISYCGIAQAGLLFTGIGSGLPSGYGGALFCAIDSAVCISGLFLLSALVEKKTGTADLSRIQGFRMPAAAACCAVLSLSVAGFPGLGGFFSRQILLSAVYDAGAGYYLCALLGIFLTVLSLLKMGRTLFSKPPITAKKSRGPGAGMLLPVCIPAALCVLLGALYVPVLTRLIAPALGDFSPAGWEIPVVLSLVYAVVLVFAAADHFYGAKRSNGAFNAADHILYAPGLKAMYGAGNAGRLDPYRLILAFMNGFSFVCMKLEHGVSWFYDKGVPGLTKGAGNVLHRFDNGRLSRYLSLAVSGLALILLVFLIVLL